MSLRREMETIFVLAAVAGLSPLSRSSDKDEAH